MTLVCFAVAQEARPFRRRARDGVVVLVTGMGSAASERALDQAFRNSRPGLLLTCGFAGGLDPALEPGTVLYSADDIPSFANKLKEAGARPGRFFCAEKVLVTARQKADARRDTGADAVEMESGHIRRICERMGIPSATVRVILDPAGADLPVNFNELMGLDQRIAPLSMAGAIARNPGLIPALLRLNRESRAAAERLAEVLVRVTVS